MKHNMSMLTSMALVATLGFLASCDSSNQATSGDPNSTQLGNVLVDSVSWGGQMYKTVKIGPQTWMAENLNFKGDGSDTIGVCTHNTIDSCRKYGRLYSWNEVMNGASGSSRNPSGVQGICPSHWHVPSDSEWTILAKSIGGDSLAGTKLKASSGWDSSGNGIDLYGFRVLPAGSRGDSGFVDGVGTDANFWSSTEYRPLYAWSRFFYSRDLYVGYFMNYVTSGFSLRCVKD